MNFSVRMFADDLLKVERTRTPGPDRDGHHTEEEAWAIIGKVKDLMA